MPSKGVGLRKPPAALPWGWLPLGPLGPGPGQRRRRAGRSVLVRKKPPHTLVAEDSVVYSVYVSRSIGQFCLGSLCI